MRKLFAARRTLPSSTYRAGEIPADGREATRIALEAHCRGPRDHAQCPDPRQIGDDLVGEPVAEILGVGIGAQIGKRENNNRFRIGRRVRHRGERRIREWPEHVPRLAEIA